MDEVDYERRKCGPLFCFGSLGVPRRWPDLTGRLTTTTQERVELTIPPVPVTYAPVLFGRVESVREVERARQRVLADRLPHPDLVVDVRHPLPVDE